MVSTNTYKHLSSRTAFFPIFKQTRLIHLNKYEYAMNNNFERPPLYPRFFQIKFLCWCRCIVRLKKKLQLIRNLGLRSQQISLKLATYFAIRPTHLYTKICSCEFVLSFCIKPTLMLTKQLALCRLHMTTLKFKQLKAKRNNNDFFPRMVLALGITLLKCTEITIYFCSFH